MAITLLAVQTYLMIDQNLIEEELQAEIIQRINAIGEQHYGKRVRAQDIIVLEEWEDDDYRYRECIFTPSGVLIAFKKEVEEYLRTIRVCHVINVTVRDDCGIEFFTATNQNYDFDEWYKSQIVRETIKKEK